MSEAVPQTNPESNNQPAPQPRSGRPWRRLIGLLLILFSVLVAWFLLVGYLGFRSGEQLLVERQQQAAAEQFARQIELATTDVAEGKLQIAQRRLEWVLAQQPGHSEAQQLQQEVLTMAGMPTGAPPTVTPPPTATPEAAATLAAAIATTPDSNGDAATNGTTDNAEPELQEIRRLMATKSWAEALPLLQSFQRVYPNYERRETDQYLYDVYINLGLDLLNGSDVEQGMFYLNQAQTLGDLPQSVRDYETWAELYLQGVAFYGANWEASAYYFRDLCLAAPFYQSSCERLREVLILYGDELAGASEWCPARDVYDEAITYENGVSLADKLSNAQEQCLLATPTPQTTEPITGTQPITDTSRFIVPTVPVSTVTPVP